MRLIDADRLLEERRIHTYYHLPNGDIAIPLIDIKNAPTIELDTDTVSRQAVLSLPRDTIRNIRGEVVSEMIDVKDIESLPSSPSRPHGQWIPVSERIPEKPENYPNCEIRRTYYLVSLESGCVTALAYEFDRDEWQYTGSPVVAWKPLPEPYKEGGAV